MEFTVVHETDDFIVLENDHEYITVRKIKNVPKIDGDPEVRQKANVIFDACRRQRRVDNNE